MSEEQTVHGEQAEEASVTDTGIEENTDATETAESGDVQESQFDSASFESEYGLPSGLLKDCETVEDATKAVRDWTDNILSAGLEPSASAPPPKSAEETTAEKLAANANTSTKDNANTSTKDTDDSPSELDAIKRELAELRAENANAKKAAAEHSLREINSRMLAEIDRLESPRFGVTGSRTFSQNKEVRELVSLVETHLTGLQVRSQSDPTVQIPPIEQIVRRVHLWADPEHKPKKKTSKAVLGTPGGASSADGKKQPRNIHEAVFSPSG